jgi:hypothetical protein
MIHFIKSHKKASAWILGIGVVALVLAVVLANNGTNVQETDVKIEVEEGQQSVSVGEINQQITEESEQEETETGIDYFEPVSTFEIKCPSTESYISDSVTSKGGAIPVGITELSKTPNGIIDTEDWFKANNLSEPEMGENENYSYEIYGNYSTDTWMRTMLTIYDKETENPKYSLDFTDFCYTNEEHNSIQEREIQWAACRDNILYVSILYNGYAEPNSCYIIAVNLDTMEVIWKSESQVSNANNFIIFDDVIMCAYGFTAEPDYIYQLDINTGETIDRYLLKTAADYLILKGDKLYVRCYDTDYVFEVDNDRLYTDLDLDIEAETEDELLEENNKEWIVDQSETMYFYLNKKIGWRLVVADAALGSRFYVMDKTDDGGITWNRINDDPFSQNCGVTEGLRFFDENFGFAGLTYAARDHSSIFITRDGGLTFEKMHLPIDNEEYDYFFMPEKENGVLTIKAATEEYDSEGIVFKSEDNGKSWEYAGVF